MTKGRLTRQELGWLLTQEAQGAAERLRKGVQVLRTQAPLPAETASARGAGDPGVDDSLDALDGVMRMLSNLHQKTPSPSRKGRIDLAALLWEVAPEARVQIEPGSGTEVFGEESDLRRMLHVLLDHAGGAGSAINVRRDGDDVRLSIVLGPDTSLTAETERVWLSRMAIRYNGRFELDGGHEILVLPAEEASDRTERERLSRELDEARRQSEAYARELAAIFEQSEQASDSSLSLRESAEDFGAWSRLAGGVAAELRALLSPTQRELAALPEDARGHLEPARQRLAAAQELASTLASAGEIKRHELRQTRDLVLLVKQVMSELEARAEQEGIKLEIGGVGAASLRLAPKAISAILRELIRQAIQSTPKDGRVLVTVEQGPEGARLVVQDEGPPLPAVAHAPVVNLAVDPRTYGRTTALPLHVCAELARAFGLRLELGDAPSGLSATLYFPR